MACLRHALPGRNDTVRLGLEALLTLQPGLAGCIFLPGDSPCCGGKRSRLWCAPLVPTPGHEKETERAIFRLAFQAENDPEPLVGSPVLFGCGYYSALRTLPEGKGGSVLLRRYPERVCNVFTADRAELLDADTPEALRELKQFLI